MELRHLRYFIAVAEELSLRRAAQRLHVSQPALSQQISDLEDELAIKLFTRNSRGVELTEAGRTYLTGGRRVLAAAKEAAEQAQEAAKGERGRLLIGSSGAPILFLSGVLARFRELQPLVEITLSHLQNRAQVEAVLNGSIMLGVGFYGYVLEEDEQEQISSRLLLRSPVVVVCPKNRRLPTGTAPKLKDFRHEKFLYINTEHALGYEHWLRGLCKQIGGFEPDIAALADSVESLIGMVAAGRGVFVGTEIGIRGKQEAWRSAGDFYPLTEPENYCELESYCELSAIWKKQWPMEPIISNFIDVLVAESKS
jgi:LysR family transcriptional regulator, benzoate and cis,cis-muconate-responsive activator of ben and cat genes